MAAAGGSIPRDGFDDMTLNAVDELTDEFTDDAWTKYADHTCCCFIRFCVYFCMF